MTAPRFANVRQRCASFAFFREPRGFILLTTLLVAGAGGWAVAELVDVAWADSSTVLLIFLVALSIAFEEGARRAARLRLRLSAQLKTDMMSVWGVAGAVALGPGKACLLLLSLLLFKWFRQHRPANEVPHRKLFSAAEAAVTVMAASSVAHAILPHAEGRPWALLGTVAVLATIVTYTVVNRIIISVGLILLGARLRDLVGSTEDNLAELATLCLGGLVALAAAHQPWLCVLALAPMIALQRGALVRELETAATIDSKTGLLNALAWDQVARRELARAQREEVPLAILIIDIDHFKRVNDRFGHLAGDAVLRAIGKCLSDEVREYDTVGRFGGEEFVAVLPAASEADALVIAERLRERVHQLRVREIAGSAPHGDGLDLVDADVVAISVGVAASPADGTELPELLYAADAALYLAKSGGRNRVALAQRAATKPARSSMPLDPTG